MHGPRGLPLSGLLKRPSRRRRRCRIVGTRIAPSPALATLPLSLSILGVASMSLPASLLMQRIGRRRAFIGSACVAAGAALLCAATIATAS